MKWLSLFKKRREERSSSPSDGEVERDYEISKKKASNFSRSSLDQWFIARKQRTSIPELCHPTTTARLQICKAGVTTLINRKYVVIKHLGSGTYGQVKLAFNLLDKKLYAVKACRKSQVCNSAVPGGKNKGHGKFGSFKLRRSSPASIINPPADDSSRMQVSEPMRCSTGIHSEPISTSSGSLVATARSMPLNVRPADSLSCPWGTTLDSLQPSGTNRQSVQSDKVSNVYQFDHSSQQNSLSATGCAKDRCPSTQNAPSDMKGSLPSGTTDRDDIQKAFDQVKAEQFVREIAIMKKLVHPNVVRLVEVINDPSSDNLLIVMEYVEGESLQPQQFDATHWQPVPEPEVWRRARDVMQGLDYLHYHEVVHGDLKPANLMMEANTHIVKIVDFGSSVLSRRSSGVASSASFGFSSTVTATCTPAFRSPESLQAGYRLSFEMDMWALGVTLYMWVFGELPFSGAAPFMVYENIRQREVSLPTHTRISEELQSMLHALLNKDPRQRIDISTAIRHQWITGSGAVPVAAIPREDAPHELGESTSSSTYGVGFSGETSACMERSIVLTCAGGDAGDAAGSAAGTMRNVESSAGCSGADVLEPMATCVQEDTMLSWRRQHAPCTTIPAANAEGRACSPRRHPPPRQWSSNVRQVATAPTLEAAGAADIGGYFSLRLTGVAEEEEAAADISSAYDGLPGATGGGMSQKVLAAGPACTSGTADEEQHLLQQQGGLFDLGMEHDASATAARKRGRGGLEQSWYARSLSQEELDDAISRSTGGTEVMEAIGKIFEEVRFLPGENIITAGEPMTHVYLLAQGEVEIYYEPLPNTSVAELLASGSLGVGRSEDVHYSLTFLEEHLALSAPIIAGLRTNDKSASSSCSAAAAAAAADSIGRLDSLMPDQGSLERHNLDKRKDSGIVEDDLDDFLSMGLNQKMSRALSGDLLANGISGVAIADDRQKPLIFGTKSLHLPRLPSVLMDDVSDVALPDAEQLLTTSSSQEEGLHVTRASTTHPDGRPCRVIVLAVKGPGDSLGIMNIDNPAVPSDVTALSSNAELGGGHVLPTWCAGVRVRGEVPVVALRAEVSGLVELAKMHPDIASAVRNIAVQQDTDLKIAEALRQLHMSSIAQHEQFHGRER